MEGKVFVGIRERCQRRTAARKRRSAERPLLVGKVVGASVRVENASASVPPDCVGDTLCQCRKVTAKGRQRRTAAKRCRCRTSTAKKMCESTKDCYPVGREIAGTIPNRSRKRYPLCFLM